MKEIGVKFAPKSNNLMSGVFHFYRKKSFPSDFVTKNYLRVNYSSGSVDPSIYIGTGSTDQTDNFASSSTPGSYVQIKMRYPVYITHYSIYQCKSIYDNRFRKWKLEGSNEGMTWFPLDDYSDNENTTMEKDGIPYLYTVQKPGKYDFIKLTMYRTARESGYISHLVFSGLEIFGTLDYLECRTTKRISSFNSLSFVFMFIYSS